MPPGAETAIGKAAESGWLSTCLCVVLLVGMGLMAFIFKWLLANMDKRHVESFNRETRMAVEITELRQTIVKIQSEQLGEVHKALANNTVALARLTDALRDPENSLEMNRNGGRGKA